MKSYYTKEELSQIGFEDGLKGIKDITLIRYKEYADAFLDGLFYSAL